ncbi:protein lin-37 homolog [Armigeres subalbatus]|uniref:protein lin-37 homolog n=1 Tax=Armigeres subalbatus TaxID=124917 RepID=UPI002ED1FCEB
MFYRGTMSKSRFPGRQSLLKVNRRTQLRTFVTRQIAFDPPTITVPSELPSPPSSVDPSLPLRGRPPKRLKLEQLSVGLRHQQGSSFIMKLFDRSVDLARFDAESPLYPVCRAWMRNQPRARPNADSAKTTDTSPPSPVGAETARSSMPDIVERFNRKEVVEISDLPQPSGTDLKPFWFESRSENDAEEPSLDEADGSAARKDILLQHHKTRWTKVRRQWQRHRQNYLRKYQLSYDLLDAVLMKQV